MTGHYIRLWNSIYPVSTQLCNVGNRNVVVLVAFSYLSDCVSLANLFLTFFTFSVTSSSLGERGRGGGIEERDRVRKTEGGSERDERDGGGVGRSDRVGGGEKRREGGGGEGGGGEGRRGEGARDGRREGMSDPGGVSL